MRSKRAKVWSLILVIGILFLTSACVVRSGSQAQATDIAYGMTKAAPTAVAQYKTVQAKEAEETALALTPSPEVQELPTAVGTEVPWWWVETPVPTPYVQIQSTAEPYQPEKEVVTLQGREWVWYYGNSDLVAGSELGQIKQGMFVEKVDSTASAVEVLYEGWVSKNSVTENPAGTSLLRCVYHTDGHYLGKSLCHAHFYSASYLDEIVAIAPSDTEVEITERTDISYKVVVKSAVWVGIEYVR